MLFRFWVFPDCTFLDISKKLIPRLLPFFAVHIVMLMLITYVPAITTWLPTFIASLK